MLHAPFFDLQVNGFAGVDFQQDNLEPAALDHAMQGLIIHNTGRILLTLITDEIDVLCRRLEHLTKLRQESPLARQIIAGFHLEGPWLLPMAGFRGAHDPSKLTAPTLPDFV